jgi:hypothetical protein
MSESKKELDAKMAEWYGACYDNGGRIVVKSDYAAIAESFASEDPATVSASSQAFQYVLKHINWVIENRRPLARFHVDTWKFTRDENSERPDGKVIVRGTWRAYEDE